MQFGEVGTVVEHHADRAHRVQGSAISPQADFRLAGLLQVVHVEPIVEVRHGPWLYTSARPHLWASLSENMFDSIGARCG